MDGGDDPVHPQGAICFQRDRRRAEGQAARFEKIRARDRPYRGQERLPDVAGDRPRETGVQTLQDTIAQHAVTVVSLEERGRVADEFAQ